MLELILVFIGGGVAGYYIGQIVLAWQLKDIVLAAIKNNAQNSIQLETNSPVKVKQLFIERINNTLYLYDRDHNEFVCQAASIEELAQLALRFKNIRYAAVMDEHTNSVFAFIEGRVENNMLVKVNES